MRCILDKCAFINLDAMTAYYRKTYYAFLRLPLLFFVYALILSWLVLYLTVFICLSITIFSLFCQQDLPVAAV